MGGSFAGFLPAFKTQRKLQLISNEDHVVMSLEEIEWVEWIDPINEACDPVFCRVTPQTAIACSKELARKKGHEFKSDEDALEEFLVVNWAYVTYKRTFRRFIKNWWK